MARATQFNLGLISWSQKRRKVMLLIGYSKGTKDCYSYNLRVTNSLWVPTQDSYYIINHKSRSYTILEEIVNALSSREVEIPDIVSEIADSQQIITRCSGRSIRPYSWYALVGLWQSPRTWTRLHQSMDLSGGPGWWMMHDKLLSN